MIIAHQTDGDMLRFNPHFHAIVLEGGFDDEGTLFYLPFSGLEPLVEVFRHRVIWMLVERKLLNKEFALKLMAWKHSGFSIDNSVRILDQEAQESLAEYISRPPISLKKIRYEPFKGRVLFHTKYSDYFKENVHMFDALDFLAELTQQVPPKRTQLIRRYWLHSSRIKGRWDQMEYIADRAPAGWCEAHVSESGPDNLGYTPLSETQKVDSDARKSAWARLIAKVYEIDPVVCPDCGAEMTVIAVIESPEEISRIMRHLIKIGRALRGLDASGLS